MIKLLSGRNLYPHFDVFFATGCTDGMVPFMSMFSQFCPQRWPKNLWCMQTQKKRLPAHMEPSTDIYHIKQQTSPSTLLIALLVWLENVITRPSWNQITMFTCGASLLMLKPWKHNRDFEKVLKHYTCLIRIEWNQIISRVLLYIVPFFGEHLLLFLRKYLQISCPRMKRSNLSTKLSR